MTETVINRPDDRLSVTINEEVKELLMTAGLVRRLASIIGSMENLESLFMDPITQSALMLETLRDRTPAGSPTDPDLVDVLENKYPMSTAEGEKLTRWIADHVTHFFIAGALTARDSMGPKMEELKSLMSSLNGLGDSITEKASAGPTEPPSAE